MAEQMFIRILNMSFTGAFVILAVLVMRLFLKKMPKIFSYCLWAVVLFRLLCPVSFSITFSPLSAIKQLSVSNGRVGAAAAFFGTMLAIKPVLHVDGQGRLIPMEKCRGRKASLMALADHMEKTVTDTSTVFISHGDCLQDAETLAAEIRRRFPSAEVYINYVGPVIGSHSGPGTLALFFVGKAR